jgi:hypothetical protein
VILGAGQILFGYSSSASSWSRSAQLLQTSTEAVTPIGTSQSAPMAFQYSSSWSANPLSAPWTR